MTIVKKKRQLNRYTSMSKKLERCNTLLYSLARCSKEREKEEEGKKATHLYSNNLVLICLVRRGSHILYMVTLLTIFIKY
jgi:hypothetical protein